MDVLPRQFSGICSLERNDIISQRFTGYAIAAGFGQAISNVGVYLGSAVFCDFVASGTSMPRYLAADVAAAIGATPHELASIVALPGSAAPISSSTIQG